MTDQVQATPPWVVFGSALTAFPSPRPQTAPATQQNLPTQAPPPWVVFGGGGGASPAPAQSPPQQPAQAPQAPPWVVFGASPANKPAQPATTSSPLTALTDSAGSVVSGVGNLGKAIDQGIQNNLPAPVAKALGATGDLANGTDDAVVNAGKSVAALGGPAQYDGQSVHRFLQDAGKGNVGGAAYDALGGLASLAPQAAAAAVPYLGPAALGASGAGNAIAAREQAQGQSSPSLGDALAGAGAGALNLGLGPASAGVMKFVGPQAGSLASRLLLRTALGGGAGAVTGAGNYALDNAGTGNMTGAGALNAAEEGAGTGLMASTATDPVSVLKSTLGNARTAAQVGPHIQAYAAETAPWNSAYQQAYTGIKTANPNLPEDQLRDIASMQAESAGVTPPTFSTLSPSAQRGLAQLGVLQMYNQRLGLATTGQGKSADDIDKSTVFKDVLGDITRNLSQTSSLLKQSGQISPDQANDLNAAIAEAKQGNRNPGQGGQAAGYFDTLQDKVQQLPIAPAYRNTISMMLRMADEAEDNSWKQASMGPLERNAGGIGAVLGGAGGLLFANHFGIDPGLGGEALEGMGGLLGAMKSGMARSSLRYMDKLMGTQLPPILKNQDAIEDYAQKNGLTNPVTPGDLQDMNQSLRMNIPSAAQSLLNRAALRNQNVLDAAGLVPQTANQGTTGTAEDAAVQAMQLRARALNNLANGPRTPMARMSRQGPAAAPVQPAPAPTSPAVQMGAMNNALNAASTANDSAIQSAFPVAGTTWQRAISQKTGLPVQFIQDHMKGLADSGALPPAVHSQITMQDQLPIGQYGRLSDYFANMAMGQGVTPPGPNAVPQGPVGPGVDPNAAIRLAKYRAAVQTAHNVHSNIASQNPDLAPIANVLAGTKVAEDRAAVLDHYLSGIADPAQKSRAEQILRPLTVFGWKPSSGTPDPRT